MPPHGSTLTLARLPYLGTAEEDVKLAEWFVGPGEPVRRGHAIALIETLKATFEVEAECDGVLLRALAGEGERVPARGAIAVVGPADAEVGEAELAELLGAAAEEPAGAASDAADVEPKPAAAPAAGPGAAPAAPAARRRAAELGVDLDRVAGSGPDGLVRVADVEAHAGGAEPRGAAGGRLDPGFLAELRRDREAFARLGSALKVAIYRRMGAVIGDGATLAPGAVIVAERIVLGRGAFVGADSTIEAVELSAGELFHLGARCRVRCRRLAFGDNAFLVDDVEVGGGGAMDPEAELVVGSHGFVGEHVHLNPCRRLELGDEVVVSRNATVMTHSFGGSYLRGYPSRFAGVTVGDGAQIGIGAVLFPGVEVGAGAILLSGSSLVSSVPAGRLFGGVPAVDLKAAAVPPSPAEVADRARELVLELARQLAARGFDVVREESGPVLVVRVAAAGGVHLLRYAAAGGALAPLAPGETPAEEVRAAASWDADAWEAAAREPDVCAVDLSVPAIRGPGGPLSDAFRELLRKRGVRLRPRSWAYSGGWL